MRNLRIFLAAIVALLAVASTARAEILSGKNWEISSEGATQRDDVLIPRILRMMNASSADPACAGWLGHFSGKWESGRNIAFTILSVIKNPDAPAGTVSCVATVLYSWAASNRRDAGYDIIPSIITTNSSGDSRVVIPWSGGKQVITLKMRKDQVIVS